MICPKCQKDINNQDEYCRFCGTDLKEDKPTPWYFQGWLIFLLIVFVGPFALPLLWGNRQLSKRTKEIITIVVLVYTLLLLIIPHLILRRIYSSILQGF